MECAHSLVWVGSALIGLVLLSLSVVAWSSPVSSIVQTLVSGFGAIPRAADVGFLDKVLGFTREGRIYMFRFLFPPFGILAIALAVRVILRFCA